MKYRIREIEKRDNKQVENVIRTCLIEFGGNHEGLAWSDPDLGRFSEVYNKKGYKYWVVVDENENVVGGCGIGKLEGTDDVCELQKMYCLKDARGTGISHEFYKRCYIETLSNMIEANKFYKKYGFIKLDGPLVKTEHYACDVWYVREL